MTTRDELHVMLDELSEALGGRKKDGQQIPRTSDRHLVELLRAIVDQRPEMNIDTSVLSEADAKVEAARALLWEKPVSAAALAEAAENLRVCVTDLLMWAGRVNDFMASAGATIRDGEGRD